MNLPTSRWRTDRAARTNLRGAAGRVRLSHAQTRATLRLALAYILAAAVAWAFGDRTWLPLHLFLAGGVVLAISGVSLMLAVTWSAAPAPPAGMARAQRWFVAAGAAGVVAGREREIGDAFVEVAGSVYLAGLVLLAGLLLGTVRRGVERRFDPAVAAYLAALAAGVVGVALGVATATGSLSVGGRAAHRTLNVLGLVGLVVGGTMPYFAATVGRSRMARHASARRLWAAVAWQAAAVAAAATGLGSGWDAVGAAGLGAYAVGITGVLYLLPRPTRRQLRWAGPRLLAVWLGATWWVAAVTASAIGAGRGEPGVLTGRWLGVLVVAGYAQILWGSLAYLLPMLRGGGHERLGEGFAVTRSWIGLAAANVAGLGLALSLPVVAPAAAGVWVADGAWRAARVGVRGRTRPPTENGVAE